MQRLTPLIDLLLYGNFFIALGALSLVWQIVLLHAPHELVTASSYAWLVFFGCLFVYAAHRIIGFTKLEKTLENRRIQIIRRFDRHIRIYALFAGLGAFILIWQMAFSIWIALTVPCLVAMAYVSPIFRGRRFRDVPLVKVFTVGLIWSWVCVFIPLYYLDADPDITAISLVALEKFLFITGITIPFDVRDLAVDRLHNIKTLPTKFGIFKSLRIANILLILALVLVMVQMQSGFLTWPVGIGLVLCYLITVAIVSFTNEKRHDYYFSAVLDGTIILQCATVWLISAFYDGSI